jgi:DNA-binding response OmpR family regulator
VQLEERKPTLLIVEDDLDIADMLNAYFRVQGYEVLTVNWGEDSIRTCMSSLPDLVILDIRLPDIDGFEVARRLRTNRKTAAIPIIFLTEKRDRSDRLRGLELKADDYVTKPFDIQELRLRVHNTLARTKNQPLANAVTGLPEGAVVDEALEAARTQPGVTFTMLEIQNIAKFREVYGFVATDDMIRAASLILMDIIQEPEAGGRFLGHMQPADFILIADTAHAAALKDRIRKKLGSSFEFFYSDQHRASGLFKQHPLGVSFCDAAPPAGGFKSLAAIKDALLRLCR